MGNIQPLIDAVAFVKANPDKHDQSECYLNEDARCVLSHAASNLGYDYFNDDSLETLATDLGITYNEANYLFHIDSYNQNDEAIAAAETLIAKYAPVKYPVGTQLRGNYNNQDYEVVGIDGDRRELKIDGRYAGYYEIENLDRGWTVIESTSAPVSNDVEYAIIANGYELDAKDDKEDAITFARGAKALADYTGYGYSIKIIERPRVVVQKEISF
jgi:hypothetical protein